MSNLIAVKRVAKNDLNSNKEEKRRTGRESEVERIMTKILRACLGMFSKRVLFFEMFSKIQGSYMKTCCMWGIRLKFVWITILKSVFEKYKKHKRKKNLALVEAGSHMVVSRQVRWLLDRSSDVVVVGRQFSGRAVPLKLVTSCGHCQTVPMVL